MKGRMDGQTNICKNPFVNADLRSHDLTGEMSLHCVAVCEMGVVNEKALSRDTFQERAGWGLALRAGSGLLHPIFLAVAGQSTA